MKNIGDYQWCQISMWDFAPKNCVEKFVKSDCGNHIFHYYLQKITAVVSENHWKVQVVESVTDVPDEILNWRNGDYRLRVDGKSYSDNDRKQLGTPPPHSD